MKPLSLQTPCPCCNGDLYPASLACVPCQIKIEGQVETNEFASLPEEDLHLLRIFVWAEGRVRDMEGPLGLSYPTIRNRLGRLKDRLRLAAEPYAQSAQAAPSPDSVLNALDAGEIDFETALQKIKKGKK